MHAAFRVTALCCLFLGIGYGDPPKPTASQLEALERFAKQPAAQIAWSKEVGRIETNKGRAVITALIVEDATQTPRQMRGIRIDLTDDAKDQVYSSEDLLDRLINALDEITAGLPRFLSQSPTRGCFGSGIFWQQSGHAFSASQCVYPDWEGLAVSTENASFRFPGINPGTFAGAIARGRDELKKR